MDLILTVKLAAIAALVLLAAYFVLNATLGFLAKFSGQLQKMAKNICVMTGVAYGIGLLLAPGYILEVSEPLLLLVKKIAPNFLDT